MGLAFLLIVVPFNQSYRSAARSTQERSPLARRLMRRQVFWARHWHWGCRRGAFVLRQFLLTRIREIDNPAIIMQRTPAEIGFVSPIQLVTAPIAALVPRAVWPGKPILDSGYEFSQTYYELPTTVYTSSAITPVGDLYRHGGWIPVIAGMFLLGCGVRLLDDVMDVGGNPHSIFLFILLFPSLVNQEDDWVGMLAGIPGTILIWLFAVYLTFRRERPHRRPSWRGPD